MAHTMHIDHKKNPHPINSKCDKFGCPFFLEKSSKKHHGINQNAFQIIKSGPSITHHKDNNKGVCCQSSIA